MFIIYIISIFYSPSLFYKSLISIVSCEIFKSLTAVTVLTMVYFYHIQVASWHKPCLLTQDYISLFNSFYWSRHCWCLMLNFLPHGPYLGLRQSLPLYYSDYQSKQLIDYLSKLRNKVFHGDLDKKFLMHSYTTYTKESWSVLVINSPTLKYIYCS